MSRPRSAERSEGSLDAPEHSRMMSYRSDGPVDSDAWTLFDPAECQRQKVPTLEAFDNIARLTGIGSSAV